MGDNNNIWYLKDGGKGWCDTKCALDEPYYIPYSTADADLHFQVDIPEGYDANEVWLCDSEGNRIQELLAIAEYVWLNQDMNKLVFKMPPNSYACAGLPDPEGCFVDFTNDHPGSFAQDRIADWIAGINDTEIGVTYLGVNYPFGVYNSGAPLPPGWTWIDGHTVALPCGVNYMALNTIYTFSYSGGSGGFTFGFNVQTGTVPGTELLSCWYLEIPLLDPNTGDEEATLRTEMFICPECEDTLVISSDYCGSETDIFGDYIIKTEPFTDDELSPITEVKNNMRIYAVLGKKPSRLSYHKNIRCNTYSSEAVRAYKLQGTKYYPPYMAAIIESICLGKRFFIDGEEYQINTEQIFTETNINGKSEFMLNAELVKCRNRVVFDCACGVAPPLSCEDDPVEYSGIMLITAAPEQGFGVDRSIWRCSIDTGLITGGTPPYTFTNWVFGGVPVNQDNTFVTYNPSGSSNFIRRHTDYAGYIPGLTALVDIVDANGCTLTVGNTVNVDDLRCVEQSGFFEIDTITDTSFRIFNVIPNTYDTYDVYHAGVGSLVLLTAGVAGDPFVQTGMTPDTDELIYIKLNCNGGEAGWVGPISIHTLP